MNLDKVASALGGEDWVKGQISLKGPELPIHGKCWRIFSMAYKISWALPTDIHRSGVCLVD